MEFSNVVNLSLGVNQDADVVNSPLVSKPPHVRLNDACLCIHRVK